MKAIYKNTTTFNEENLSVVYRLLTKETRTKYLGLGILSLILCCIYYILSNIGFSYTHISLILIWLGFIFLFFGIIFLVLWLYLSVYGHKKRANKFVEQEKLILNVDKLLVELSFYEDKVTQYNPNSKGSVDFFYNKFNEIMETEHYFILYSKKDKNKFFILVDKNGFTEGSLKTFKGFIVSKIESEKKVTAKENAKKTR